MGSEGRKGGRVEGKGRREKGEHEKRKKEVWVG